MPYIFQFILLPLIFPDIRGDRIGYAANVFNLIFPILGMAFLTDKLFHWSLGAFAYSFLDIANSIIPRKYASASGRIQFPTAISTPASR